MSDICPSSIQRDALVKFADALGSAPRALRRDDCGDPCIVGTRGHIFAVCGTLDQPGRPGFAMYVMGWTARGWNAAKDAIGKFATILNDGEDDGALYLSKLPTPTEAETIRKWCGVAKKRDVSEGELARLRQTAFPAKCLAA